MITFLMDLTFMKDSSIDIHYKHSSKKYLITYKNKIYSVEDFNITDKIINLININSIIDI